MWTKGWKKIHTLNKSKGTQQKHFQVWNTHRATMSVFDLEVIVLCLFDKSRIYTRYFKGP